MLDNMGRQALSLKLRGALTCLVVAAAFGLAAPCLAQTAADSALVPEIEAWRSLDWNPDTHFSTTEQRRWSERADGRRLLSLVGTIAGFVFYGIFLFGPLPKRLLKGCEAAAARLSATPPFASRPAASIAHGVARFFGDDWAAALLYTLCYLVAGFCVGLPFWIAGEAMDRSAGLSNYSTSAWLWDLLKGELILWGATFCLVVGIFGLIRRLPRSWWLVIGIPSALLLILQGLLAPEHLRLYHDVEPLEDDALRQRIELLAGREGFELEAVRVVDASRVTCRVGAMIHGVGPSRELLLYDTLLEGLDDDAVLAAVAHELGHERRRNTSARYGLAALGLLALLGIVALALRLFAHRLGFHGPGDVRTLALVMLVTSTLLLIARPARLAYSRYEERLADRAGLTMTGDPEAFIRLQLELARQNQADLEPTPLEVFWFASHPPLPSRVGEALWYARWLESFSGSGILRRGFEIEAMRRRPERRGQDR